MRRLSGWGPLVALVAVLLVGTFALGGSTGGDGPPLDPRSAKGLGTKGLVETLRALGGDVTITDAAPDRSFTTALLLSDDLTPSRRREIDAWVRAGGTLLVADPASPLAPWEAKGTTDTGLFPADLDKRCDLAALRGVGRVSADGNAVYDAPKGVTRCYPRNDGWWLVAARHGVGNVVAVGGARPFVNRHLDEADNAAVAAAVLVPRPGARVAFLRPPPPGTTGRRSLVELISPRVKAALWQLAIAFAVVALWRARRLGRPVLETQPVQLAASELTVAVGDLLQRSGNRRRAAELLRSGLRRELADRLGLPPTLADDAVADAVAARSGVDARDVAAALTGPLPRADDELVEFAQRIESVRREVIRVPTP